MRCLRSKAGLSVGPAVRFSSKGFNFGHLLISFLASAPPLAIAPSNKAMADDKINLKIQFGGGMELLFGNVRSHEVSVPSLAPAIGSKPERPADITFLIQWMKENMLKEREELFIDGLTV